MFLCGSDNICWLYYDIKINRTFRYERAYSKQKTAGYESSSHALLDCTMWKKKTQSEFSTVSAEPEVLLSLISFAEMSNFKAWGDEMHLILSNTQYTYKYMYTYILRFWTQLIIKWA